MYATRWSNTIILLPLLVLLATFSLISPLSVHAQSSDPVTVTQHAQLGFTTSVPFGPLHKHDSALGLFYDIVFSGTVDINANMGADISLTYDPTLIAPGATVPMTMSYEPTSSHVDIDISGTAVADFSGCTNCPATVPLTLAAGSSAFIPPLTGDPSATISGSSSTITLSVAGISMI